MLPTSIILTGVWLSLKSLTQASDRKGAKDCNANKMASSWTLFFLECGPDLMSYLVAMWNYSSHSDKTSIVAHDCSQLMEGKTKCSLRLETSCQNLSSFWQELSIMMICSSSLTSAVTIWPYLVIKWVTFPTAVEREITCPTTECTALMVHKGELINGCRQWLSLSMRFSTIWRVPWAESQSIPNQTSEIWRDRVLLAII